MAGKTRVLQFRSWHRPAPPARSLWLQQALRDERAEEERSAPALRTTERADVCIIGGGYTGLWTALRLTESDPALKVILLEADVCGSGASGRNSGAVGSMAPMLARLRARLGDQGAATVYEAGIASEREILDTCRVRGIDAHVQQTDHIWATRENAVLDAWRQTLEIGGQLGVQLPFGILQGDELAQRVRAADAALAGLYTPVTTYLQPARLARGLRRVILEAGVAIYEETPVTELVLDSAVVRVLTPSGAVNCDRLVLATNAWTAHLPQFRRSVMVLSSDMVATGPIHDRIEQARLKDLPRGRRDSRVMVTYGRVKDDGIVYMGRAGGTVAYDARITAQFDRSWKQTRELLADFPYLFPELGKVELPHWWAGPIDRSGSGLPFFGCLHEDERVLYGIGYTGHGVMATSQGGHILADLCLGKTSRWTELSALYRAAQIDGFPPEPLRYVGARIVRGSLARKEHAERDGRRPATIDRLLSRLAVSTVPVRTAGAAAALVKGARPTDGGTRLG